MNNGQRRACCTTAGAWLAKCYFLLRTPFTVALVRFDWVVRGWTGCRWSLLYSAGLSGTLTLRMTV